MENIKLNIEKTLEFISKEKLKFIKKLALERGIIVLTDSDHSGFQIRNFISSGIPKNCVKHIYIPDIYGKEKRKDITNNS